MFGPAYKGIPLGVSTAIALTSAHGMEVGYTFDRKEKKDHGDGGMMVGTQLADGMSRPAHPERRRHPVRHTGDQGRRRRVPGTVRRLTAAFALNRAHRLL